MKEMNPITMTLQDVRRLSAVISLYDEVDAEATSALQEELDRANVVPPTDVPAQVVTMNSRIVCRDEAGATRELEVVYPWHADAAAGRISVLAPLGRALIGAAVGHEVKVSARGRVRRWALQAIPYQPESAGDYHL